LALTVAAWSASAADLPSDGRIQSGKLDNGVTWMFRKHDNPPGKTTLLLHIRTGSLNETEEQRGLAHFMEHMCFNGSEHFAPGELVPYFESIGMEFGNDLNAFTSFDQTVYMLFTPDTKVEQIDKALMVLSDYAFRVLLLEEEINKERGVVLEEARAGKNAQQRVRDKLFPELFEGSRFANRLVIGKEEVIANAPRNEFVDYYRTWYRPANMTVVVTGDTDLDSVLPSIKKWFGEYEASGSAKDQHSAEFKPFTEQRAIVVTDPELAGCRVQMYNIKPARPAITTEELWRTKLVDSVSAWIIGRRFDEMVRKGQASFRSAQVDTEDFFHDATLVTGMAIGEPPDWNKMFEQVITEIHRAREHGFHAHELELAKKEILASAERAVRTEPTRDAQGIAFEIVFRVNDKEPVLSAEQELALYQKMLPTVDLAEVNRATQENFAPATFAYVVTSPDKPGIEVPKREDVLAAVKAAWAREVESISEDQAPDKLLAELPSPGAVAESTHDDDLDITNGWLANGVRFHHRYMDYKKDEVMVTISLAGGEIEETAENAGITEVACLAINEGGTSRLSSSNIRDLMTGKNIAVSADSSDTPDAVVVRVDGSPRDLEVGLQKVYALLTDGKLEESAFKNWKLGMLQRIDRLEKMPRYVAAVTMEELVSGGDPRRSRWTKERIERQSMEKAQAWFERLGKSAPIEVAVVGDMPLSDVQPLLERYLGSLSERPRETKHLDKLRRLARPTGPLSRMVKVETQTPQAMALAGFVGCEAQKVSDRRALELASNILTSRLVKHIREDLSLVYGIRARTAESEAYEEGGRFMAGAPCDPNNAAKLVEEVRKMFDEFAEKGPSAEELTNAKKQIAENLDRGMREPGYWSRVLQTLNLHSLTLKDQKEEKEAFEKFTGEQVRDVFKKYDDPSRRFTVLAEPALVPTTDKAPTAEEPAS